MSALLASQREVAERRQPRAQGRRVAARVLGVGIAVALFASCFASCSFVEPEVGKFRGACKGSGGEYARPDAYSPGQPDPRCTPAEGAEPCEVCEDTHCCGTRFGCYDNDGCECADEAFDECLDGIADPTTEEGVAATARCWAAFSSSSATAKGRVDCQREFCKDECGVP
jgi:hypothetical protein